MRLTMHSFWLALLLFAVPLGGVFAMTANPTTFSELTDSIEIIPPVIDADGYIQVYLDSDHSSFIGAGPAGGFPVVQDLGVTVYEDFVFTDVPSGIGSTPCSGISLEDCQVLYGGDIVTIEYVEPEPEPVPSQEGNDRVFYTLVVALFILSAVVTAKTVKSFSV